MKDKERKLRIYNFSHPLMNTEIMSIFGDKFSRTLSFEIEFVQDPESSDVILWDGIIGLKSQHLDRLQKSIAEGKTLFLLGESHTLFKGASAVRPWSLEMKAYIIEAYGWSLLPEDIITKLEACYQKLHHV